MGATIHADSVFFPLTALSHGREVAPWQILPMTTPTMSRRFGVEIEVRHHSGTTDPAKITNWVRLMARMFDY
jgi:hypothetical protein